MSKAKDILEKLKQRREDAEAIKAYWEGVLPGIGNLPESQLQGWLQRFGLETIIAGLDAAVIKRSKLDAKGESITVQAVVDYASGAMRETHFESLSDGERAALADKAAEISAKRSSAGKLGRAKQLADGAKACEEFARVCPALPKVARPLLSGNGSGVGSGFAFDPALEDGHAAASEHAPKPAATPPPTKNEDQKTTPKPETKSNPAGASSLLANQNPKPDRGFSLGYVADKPKVIKTAKGAQPMPDGFDNWTNVKRTEWIACTCEPMQAFGDGEFIHRSGCALKSQAKAAVTADAYPDDGINWKAIEL